MDSERFVKAIAWRRAGGGDPIDVLVAWDGSTLRRADEDTGWQVSAAPNPAGTFARLTPPGAPDETRVADLNLALMAFLDAGPGTAFGELTVPPDVRRR